MKATFWTQATPGTTYWRCELPARFLPGQVLDLETSDVVPDPVFSEGLPYFPRQRGAAIWQFPGNATRGLLMAGMQELKIPVLLEADDNYTIPGPKIPGGGRWKEGVDRVGDAHSNEAHRKIAGWVDGVTVSTPELARVYGQINSHVYVCQNAVDPADWVHEAPSAAGAGGHTPGPVPFRIGYAGSHSHYFDLALIEKALRWASAQDGVEVVIYGLQPKWDFPYTAVPWAEDLAAYRQSLFGLDVGLCPLLRGVAWNNCRSDIKALEYAMVGALPVVSRTKPYEPWYVEPCHIATNGNEFLAAVKWAVANQSEVKRIAAEAKAYVLKERTMAQNIWRWQEAIDDVTKRVKP